MLKPRVISLQAMDFQCDNYYLLDALIHIIYGGGGGGGNSRNKDKFFQTMMNFESCFNNFGNIFVMID